MGKFREKFRSASGRPKRWHIALAVTLTITIAFSIYLWSLFRQLTDAFERRDQFVPTRIYSDVTRIVPSQPRRQVEARLLALGYPAPSAGAQYKFRLHEVDYPDYLVPENYAPRIKAGQNTGGEPGPEIIIGFDGSDNGALVQSIQFDGQEIPELFLEPELIASLSRAGEADSAARRQIRDFVPFERIPSEVWKAIIAIEDQHFLEHRGFDPRGLIRAVWVNARTLSFAQGGSTITQQLVKNLTERRGKNVFRKVNELFLSLILEIKFDKERILERYLNEVSLGQVGNYEVHGVKEGAELFFGKRLDELNLAEISLMAGVIRGTNYYSPYKYRARAIERQKLVLAKMVETGQIAEEEKNEALKQPIRLAPPRTVLNKAPYFTDFVKAELIRLLQGKMAADEVPAAGLRVYSTLDVTINSAAQRAVSNGMDDLEQRLKVVAPARLEGALAAVEQGTGQVRALIGGRSYAHSTFNRILNMRRQVGSTFKPVVYLTAFAKGLDANGVAYGPGRPYEDAPWKLKFDHGRQTWVPHNYEPEFLGWIDLRTALAHSINTVAARLGVEVGIDAVIDTARRLGIVSELPAVPSLSLGVAELSPIELVQAYATIANHGMQPELTVIRGITQNDGTSYARFATSPKPAVSPGPADLLADTMQTVFTHGTAEPAIRMGWDRPAAGKTGTTSNHRDAWFAGFTPQLTAVVWVGADQDAPAPAPTPGQKKAPKKVVLRLSGAGSALPIWVRFMNEALAGEPPAVFSESTFLTTARIDRHTGKAATVNCRDEQTTIEKYVIGMEPQAQSCDPSYPPTVSETEL